jgi:four helix bundle protein
VHEQREAGGWKLEAGQPRRPIRSFRDLEVYQNARAALRAVHEVALTFPDYEKFDLADQIRRASKSVAANITEGYALRQSAKEFKRYLRQAMASANEMEAHIEIAADLGYVTAAQCEALRSQYQSIGKQLHRLIETWRTFR